jgi:hypothetical protein
MYNKRGGRGGYNSNSGGNSNYRGGRGRSSTNYNNYNNNYNNQGGGHHYSNKHNYSNNYYYNNNDNYGYNNNYSQSHQQYQQQGSNYYYGNQQQYQQPQYGYDNNYQQPSYQNQYQNYTTDQQQQQFWIDPAHYLQVFNNPEYASFAPMDRIPDTLIVKIFSFLQDYKMIVHLSEVSRRWMYVTEENDLWMSLATNHPAYKSGKCKKTEEMLPWKIFFMEMLEDEKDAARHQVDLAMTAQMMNELNIVEDDDDDDIDRYIEEFERQQQAALDTEEDESGEGSYN